MRPGVALVLLVLATASARAEGPVPIAVQPFSGRCFDAAQLAERVRARVGEVPVTVAAPPRGSRQEVRVSQRGDAISVEVTARDSRGQIVGSAHRLIPADDCATALEVAGLIVARAAMPLNWRENPPEPAPRKHTPTPTATVTPPPNPVTPPANAPTTNAPEANPATANANPTTAQTKVGPPTPKPFPMGQSIDLRPVCGPPAREPGTIILSTRGPNRRWVGEIDAAVYGAFNLDAGAENPGGELALGFRGGRFGAAARGAIERDWSTSASSSAGPLALSLRRAAVGLEAHADVPVRVGAIRFVVGPSLALWTVRASGLPHPKTTILPSFAAVARVLYHLDLGRTFLAGGVDFEYAPTSEDLTVTGVGVIAHTPRLSLGPILAFGVNL